MVAVVDAVTLLILVLTFTCFDLDVFKPLRVVSLACCELDVFRQHAADPPQHNVTLLPVYVRFASFSLKNTKVEGLPRKRLQEK
jgi:hypothetical protein